MTKAEATLEIWNSRKAPRAYVVEPWAADYTLLADQKMTIFASASERLPRFTIQERDEITQIWCDETDSYSVTLNGHEIECGHQRQPAE